MTSVIYPKAAEAMLQGNLNLTGTVKAVLVDTADYTYSAAHDNLDDVPAGARVATSNALASKTYTNGTFDAADLTWASVTGDQAEAIIIYIDSGVESTSKLVAYIDSGTGLPVTPNSGDIDVQWNAAGIFSLV